METFTEVKIYSKPKNVYNAIAKEIIKMVQNSNQEIFDIALSGGYSPKGLFKKISKKYAEQVPWQRIHLWWGDERCVPPTDEQSNYKMTVDYLISNINIPENNIHRIQGEQDPELEALRYSKEMEDTLNSRGKNPVFDLIILGLGDDGHTASIFPDQLDLFEHEQNCAVAVHPLTGQKRITITGNVINNANQVFFLVTGTNKALRISEIMNDNDAAQLLPAYYISPENGTLTWFLDEEAAAQIS
ncbi:6-phosphogluconolactonase [Draconibacterium sp. IB214405]|uniref:6-phosphogluconolactonase n=1 Tax=Draconibacterium sp. IB214405 TaxID=3097352 RepID=UPI002A158E21|nr:6-phosphogluconolactonase [Draconibacterium sp. IB214405]MDX8341045.1 6-phosphogluconolactonase [Draconibacterium sp. IB214405]